MLYDERQVGAPFREGDPPETHEYAFRRGEHILVLPRGDDVDETFEDVARGPCAFGAIVDLPVLWFCWIHRPVQHWSAGSFSWHVLPKEERVLPPPVESSERAIIQTFLVNEGSGLLVAKRRCLVSLKLTRVLHGAIHAQAACPMDLTEYRRKVALWEDFALSPDDYLGFMDAASLGEGLPGEGPESKRPPLEPDPRVVQ